MVSSASGSDSRQLPSASGVLPGRWFVTPLTIFLATRVALLVLVYASVILVPLNPSPGAARVLPGNWLLDGWLRWDAVGYLALADQGYWYEAASGAGSATLPPLYPAAVAAAAGLIGQTPQAALLLANLFAAAALVALYRLLADRLGDQVALISSILICVLPYGFLFSSAYPHGLALLLVCLALVAAERRRLWPAIAVGALCPLALPAGFAVWPALALLLSRGGGWRAMSPLLLLPLPTMAFAYYLASVIQMPSAMIARAVFGLGPSSPLSSGFAGLAVTSLAAPHGLLAAFNLGLGLVFLSASPFLPRLLGWPYTVFNVSLVLFTLLADPAGLGSWLLLAVPAVALAAHLLRHEVTSFIALGVSSLFLAVLAAAFATWHPFTGNAITPWAANEPARLMTMYAAERALPENVLGLRVADDILVLGGDRPAQRIEPGGSLPLSLYLHRLRATTTDYLLSAHLLDQEGKRWGTAQAMLARQTATPRLYQREQGRYGLNLLAAPGTPAGLYSLEASFLIVPPFSTVYERPAVTDLDGEAVDQLILGRVLVAGQDTVMNRAAAQPPVARQAVLGEEIELLGHGLEVRAAGDAQELRVDLFWGARAKPAYDYTVFVQALAGNGEVLAQADSYPLAGRFPTSALDASLVIRDTYELRLPAAMGAEPVKVIAGMYRLDTMQRLPVRLEGGEAGDHIVLGEIDGR